MDNKIKIFSNDNTMEGKLMYIPYCNNVTGRLNQITTNIPYFSVLFSISLCGKPISNPNITQQTLNKIKTSKNKRS